MLCSESLPLWNLVNRLICSPGKLQKRKKTSHHTCFHFLTVSSFLSKFLNSHSGRIHWIRHSQGLWRSLEIDTGWKCKKLNKNNVLYKTTTPHVYQNMNIVLLRNLGESWHLLWRKRNTRPCKKVGCLRPAATFSLLFSPRKNRPVLDLTVPLGVQFLREMKERDVRRRLPTPHPASPPSRSTSSSNEPPVKQKAEQSCAQAPPQRPLVPLVSMILKQQMRRKHAQVRALFCKERNGH